MKEYKFRLSGEMEPVSSTASQVAIAFNRLGMIKRLQGKKVLSCWTGVECPGSQGDVVGRVSYNELIGMTVTKPTKQTSEFDEIEFDFVENLGQ